MSRQTLMLILGLSFAALMVLLNQDRRGYLDDEYRQPVYSEIASVLWKARIFSSEIQFLSAGRIIYTLHFAAGETHIRSVSYRNLDGYYDPVLITVLRLGMHYRSIIIDPTRQQQLLRVDAESEIDVTVSDKNKVLITYDQTDPLDGLSQERVVVWPKGSSGD